jgi:hypothetical protein
VLSIDDELVIAQDSATMACAGGNAVYFAFYVGRAATLVRRVSAAVLATMNLGIFVERLHAIDLYLASQDSVDFASPEPASWLLAHLLLFLGTAATTALIVRQLLHR